MTLENFADLIDQQSWEEFMPRGVTKELFKEFTVFYDPDMFRAVGRNYRDLVRAADELPPVQRVQAIARIFEYFRNPDKETVLTPWRVVNMHIGDCIGGWNYLDSEGETRLMEPKFIDHGEVTDKVFGDPDTRILEINSKTGLYPLYMALSVFKSKCRRYRDSHMLPTDIPVEKQRELWNEVLRDNIFVVCKTEMAKQITRRTLRGFGKAKVNARYFEDLLNKITNQPQLFTDKVTSGKQYWKNYEIEEKMKFNAIVGNPPYQVVKASENNTTNAGFSSAIYPYFIEIAYKLYPEYISMITPSRWLTKQGQGVSEDWADKMIHCNHFMTMHDYIKETDCFEGVEIKGGVSYFLLNQSYIGKCNYYLHRGGQTMKQIDFLDALGAGVVIRDTRAIDIINAVCKVEGKYYTERTFSDLVSPLHFYDKDGQLSSNWKGYSLSCDSEHFVKYYLNKQLVSSGYAWITKDDIPKNQHTIDAHKIFLSAAYNGGDNFPHQIIGKPFYGEPGSVCSQTYNCIGYDEGLNKEECLNIISYIKTKFFRYMVSIKKKTQGATSSVFQFVPLQDWSKPWTDAELYKKYDLSKDEIAYIESMIKPMGGEAHATQQ